jgi:hypothetical protein
VGGSFHVIEASFDESGPTSLTATFEQHCEQDPGNVLYGFIHFDL